MSDKFVIPPVRDAAAVDAAFAHVIDFIGAGYHLFPLRVASKIPRDKGWQTRDYDGFDWSRWLAIGGNIGVALGVDDLVVDADPRHYVDGVDSFERLCSDLGVDLRDAPTVLTGGDGGGAHRYYRRPPGIRLRGKLDGYPGIDFKMLGGLVVAPGSLHPDTGRVYDIDPLTPDISRVGRAPAPLIDALRRPDRSSERVGVGGELTPEDLAVLLDALDPRAYGAGKYDDWIRLAAACHDATNGDGFDEWADWCERDPTFGPEYRDRNEAHWDSFEAGKPDGITYLSLLRAVSDAGRPDLVAQVGLDEDDILIDPELMDDFDDADAFTEGQPWIG